MIDQRRTRVRNVRTGLLLAAVALAFYLFILIRYQVFGQ
ncbi:MAG: cytochrome oxidase small assembly protein [Rhodocyclaceae bacterium]|nr:cytochrome oxidase small assembly protein [Rhodocyclaceae bacterium]